MNKLLIGLMCLAGALTACGDANDRAEDQREAQAEANAIAAGAAVAALGLTEMQLLDADIVDGANAEIGDVAGVIRGANGQVERLLVEIEDSNPDRFGARAAEASTYEWVMRQLGMGPQPCRALEDRRSRPNRAAPMQCPRTSRQARHSDNEPQGKRG